MDHYGATNAAEFFAVATETFFEKPLQMRENKPALYAQLSGYYRQDPATRVANAKAAAVRAAASAPPSKTGKTKRKKK
jgi:Mlc titration factor MtfA (ptsG expression regulator)